MQTDCGFLHLLHAAAMLLRIFEWTVKGEMEGRGRWEWKGVSEVLLKKKEEV